MKKLILLAVLFVGVGVQQVSAQKWLKTLGKVANAALTDDQKKTESKGKATTAATGKIPGCTIKYTSCAANGNNVHINFVITNTTTSELKLYLNPGSENSCAYDSKNVKHEVKFALGGKELGFYEEKVLPSNVPVKGTLIVKDVDRTIKQINSATIKGKSNGTEFSVGVPTQIVAVTKNTNADNIVCSRPDLLFTFKKCVRVGDNVEISAVLKNMGNKEIEVETYHEDPTIYDGDGETYELDRNASPFGTSIWKSYTNVKMPTGIPVKVKYTIKGVSASATEFSIIKLPFTIENNKYYIEFRNQPISAQ